MLSTSAYCVTSPPPRLGLPFIWSSDNSVEGRDQCTATLPDLYPITFQHSLQASCKKSIPFLIGFRGFSGSSCSCNCERHRAWAPAVVAAITIFEIVVGNHVAAASRAHDHDLVEAPRNVVFDQSVGGVVVDGNPVAGSAGIRITCGMDVGIAQFGTERAFEEHRGAPGVVALDVLGPRVRREVEDNAAVAGAARHRQVFDANAARRQANRCAARCFARTTSPPSETRNGVWNGARECQCRGAVSIIVNLG